MKNNQGRIFAFPQFEYLLSRPRKIFEAGRYPNGELTLKLNADTTGKGCVLLGTIAPPDENLVSFLSLAHTLKKEGATRVTAVMPYLAYMREDKNQPGQSQNAALIGKLLRAAGVDEIVTIDIHSPKSAGLLNMPLKSISPAQIWADNINELKNPDATTIVAPDEGALPRARNLAVAARIAQQNIAFVKKKRIDGISETTLHGKITKNAIIVDDILDTGSTLAACARELKKSGANNIVAAVSHGLFSTNA